uniref:Uncharacterized protein n=1 Tax=Globodera rostochiensis TaxID=31243 RepID=A0A914I8W5_GLORO
MGFRLCAIFGDPMPLDIERDSGDDTAEYADGVFVDAVPMNVASKRAFADHSTTFFAEDVVAFRWRDGTGRD